jgi:tetratricopeptide (TPR) repeat protein
VIYIVALLIALAGVIVIAYPLFRRKDRSDEAEAEGGSGDFRARREKVYDAVRELELEREAGSVSQEEYEKIRAAYEMRAAGLLQEEEQQSRHRPEPAPKPAPTKAAAASPRRVSQRLGLLVPAAIILLVGVAIGFFLGTSLTITGNAPGGGGAGVGSPSSLQEANAAFDRGDFRQASEGYKKVLEKDPNNVEALTQIGALLARGGHYDGAIIAFDRVLDMEPNYPKALFEKGLVLFQGKGQPREGRKAWEQLIQTAPSDNQYAMTAKRLLEQVRGSTGRPPTASSAPPSAQ